LSCFLDYDPYENEKPVNPLNREDIKRQDFNTRYPELLALEEQGNPSAIQRLIELLHDDNHYIREAAADSLGRIGDASTAPALIEALKDENQYVRESVAQALGSIGDVTVIPALIEALSDSCYKVNNQARQGLINIGSASVPALVELLKDGDRDELINATQTLGKIGDVGATPSLLNALKYGIYWEGHGMYTDYTAIALGELGDSKTLPRKILAYTTFTVQQKIDILERLRRARYYSNRETHLYTFPDTPTLCQKVLTEEDMEGRIGAQSVLNWLNEGRYLLRSSQPDSTIHANELVRASHGGTSETQPETLLLPSEEPAENPVQSQTPTTFWQRLFRKR
jgi:hypothetical protein